jgi:hypothetical protein
MRLIYFATLLLINTIFLGQTIFWQENFDTGCHKGRLANGSVVTPSNGVWVVQSLPTGPNNGAQANEWFISSTASGNPVGNCGGGCTIAPSLTNTTLHIGLNLSGYFVDPAGAYIISASSNTNKRVYSNIINCSGYSSITLSFNYFSNQKNATDYAEVSYYDGLIWSALSQLGISTCTNNVGLWASYSINLPASANNNPDVRIGFRWQNDSGPPDTLISVAIDSIKLSGIHINGLPEQELKLPKIFPNPFTDFVEMDWKDGNNQKIDLQVLDCFGELKYSERNLDSSKPIGLNYLSKGVYIFKLTVDEKTVFRKFVKN